MLPYHKLVLTNHPFEDGEQILSFSINQKIFRPFGYLLDSTFNEESNDNYSYTEGTETTVYYIPERKGNIDLEWLKSTGPKSPAELIKWTNLCLKEYKKSIADNSFNNELDDFDSRILESIAEFELEKRFNKTKQQLLDIVATDGIYPFLHIDEIIINQKKCLFQICCNSEIEAYFINYDFGIYKTANSIEYAAPQVSVPEW